jgi:hypothetical protein
LLTGVHDRVQTLFRQSFFCKNLIFMFY